MLLSHWHFCTLDGRCFQFIYERVIIYSNDRLPLAAPHFPTISRPLRQIYIHGFNFEFVGTNDDKDIFYYDISCDDFRMTFVYYGIDSAANCDTSSNLDFDLPG